MNDSQDDSQHLHSHTIISIDDLINALYRGGDLNESHYNIDRVYRDVLNAFKTQKSECTINHPIGYLYNHNGIPFLFEGIIDVLLLDEDMPLTETVAMNESDILRSASQVRNKILAYLFCKSEEMNQIETVIHWYSIDGEAEASDSDIFTVAELETCFKDELEKYLELNDSNALWRTIRNESIADLQFPFVPFRKGQREMMAEVYTAAKNKLQVLIQAPTGIGKTLASLFPAIKSLEAGYSEKIFYLTARTTGREIAENALTLLREKGLRLKSITIVSKEKICFIKDNPKSCDNCKYAKGYYERLVPALIEGRTEECQTRLFIETLAEKHTICPFELTLDLSTICDCIICDYNYVFDPFVALKRYFGNNGGDYHFLVDEAHNLVDRGRDMFSAELDKKDILEIRRELKPYKDAVKYIYRDLGKINTWFLNKVKEVGSSKPEWIEKGFPEELLWRLRAFVRSTDDWLDLNKGGVYKKVLLDTYYTVKQFVTIAEMFNERFRCIYTLDKKSLSLKLYCIDPSQQLNKALSAGSTAALFSATLAPMHFYKELLGLNADSRMGALPSPFPPENLSVLVADSIHTAYKYRDESLVSVVESIETVVDSKVGNYLVYFPSYRYMMMAVTLFEKNNPQVKCVVQQSGMSEDERTEFINHFHELAEARDSKSLVGFAVMGGVFGEGVDLTGDRLSGVVVVGVGLPGISTERNLVRDYFDQNRIGFEYAYMYPGMNKVLQAAGRVIRTMSDTGVVLLIDSRFSRSEYSQLFPQEWAPVFVKNSKEIVQEIDHNFFN